VDFHHHSHGTKKFDDVHKKESGNKDRRTNRKRACVSIEGGKKKKAWFKVGGRKCSGAQLGLHHQVKRDKAHHRGGGREGVHQPFQAR